MMFVDLRSDTFTKPCPEMREWMKNAEVGDDVFAEDPTVNRLQEEVSSLLGKEAGLFVASGVMGNQVAINAHTQPGEEVILEQNAHIFYYEAGAPAMLSGVQLRTVPGENGILTDAAIEKVIRPYNVHFPPTRLICLENTHNRAGGKIYPLDEIKKIHNLSKKYGLNMHLDGARLWNASVATGISLKEYARYFDSVSVCFSKGLGAPIGSMIVGSKEFIKKAHRYRKIYGGGMRQAGIIAAGALYAVNNNIKRLSQDHNNAKKLAEGFNSITEFSVDMDNVETNIVMVDIDKNYLTADQVAAKLKKHNILILSVGPQRLRAVTHLDVDSSDIDTAVDAIKSLF
ncbi:MAG: low-specificity L-threonine aldolase [bacterium]